jgi:hypothetical protein
MKNVMLCFALLWSVTYALEGPDFMLIGRRYLPALDSSEITTFSTNHNVLDIYFSNANLYDIKSLNWFYGEFDYHTYWGNFGLNFRDYGINDLYSSTRLDLSYSRPLIGRLSIGAGYVHDSHSYGDRLFRGANDYLSVNSVFSSGRLSFAGYLNDIPIHKGIKGYAYHPEIILSSYWQAEDILALYAIYYKDHENHSRLNLGQKLRIAGPLFLEAGLITSPQVYYLGTTIAYKRFAFEYAFYDFTQLPGCWSLALIYR